MPSTTVPRLVSRLAQGLTVPFVPDDYLDLVAPLRSGADLRGRIVAVHPETAEAATITIRPGRDWAGHVPGQYVRLGVDVDGVRRWRAYSITSVSNGPTARDRTISITVKAMADGLVSRHLVHRTRPGTVVALDQATGDFVLPQAVPRGLLFLTGGSGITPVMGMRRNHDLRERDAVHIHSAPTAADVIFAEELRRESPGVRTHVRHTDDEGMLDPAALDALVPDWRERETWLCGPTPMLDAFEAVWAEAGIADRLHVERFRPAITATGEGGRISLTTGPERTEVEADGATTVLDAAEDAGVIMPSGCRMGVCFGCVLPMTDGAVRDLRNGTLTETTPDDPPVKVQTCISAVAGACTIETQESA